MNAGFFIVSLFVVVRNNPIYQVLSRSINKGCILPRAFEFADSGYECM
jgi:hypothetical protein